MALPVEQRDQRLVVVIPALNEEQTIERVVAGVPRQLSGFAAIDVLVVDDGSSDRTAELAREAGAEVVSHAVNRGVGAAFQTGLRAALARGADVIVNVDADGQFDPTDIPKLLEPIRAERAEFVTASRFASPELVPTMPRVKRWGNWAVVQIVNIVTGKRLTDVSCGFRAYSREAALRLTLFGSFTYTQETFIDLAFKNIAMTEVPLRVRGEREFGKSRVASNLWRYALKSATIMFRAARDYVPHYFFGIPGLVIFGAGLAAALFLLVHFVQTGQTYPYRSLVSVSGVLIIVGFLMLFLSLLADMLHRNRMIAEEMVYLLRKSAYAKRTRSS